MRIDIANLDRRLIYLLVLVALIVPLLYQFSVPPARMRSAERFYQVIEEFKPLPGEIALVAFDYGPNSKAENVPQSEVAIEHLFLQRIPFAVFSQYAQAEPFLESIPEQVAQKLMQRFPDQVWTYGVDWVNLGYRAGGFNVIKSIAASEDLPALLRSDTRSNLLAELPVFKDVMTLKQIPLLIQFTSLVGTLDTLLQFLKRQDHRPVFLHGCTSITIPQAYIFLDSGQLRGLHEGIAGAAWYSVLLNKKYPDRPKDSSFVINTGLGVAHLVIILLVLFGNLVSLTSRKQAHG